MIGLSRDEFIGLLGESLVVFCVFFVCIVGVIKLAERSVDLEGSLVLRGARGRETGGGAGQAETRPSRSAASRRDGGVLRAPR